MCLVWRIGIVVRTSDPQSRESRFKSSWCSFEVWIILFMPHCFSYINEYLVMDSGGYVNEYCSHSNCSMDESFRDKSCWCGMNRSARGEV